MKMHKYLLLLALVSFAFAACSDEPEDPDPVSGAVTLKFENRAGSQPLDLNGTYYQNENGDSLTVTVFNYYISNIQLKATDNTVYTESNSYHLVQSSLASSLQFDLSKVPGGDYRELSFLIGVDSARNVSGAQTGALDPAHGMFWTWNSGYVMAKVEGTSPQSTHMNKEIIFHVGGFSGANSSLRRVTLPLSTVAKVTAEGKPLITLNADVLAWFRSPEVIDFSTLNVIHMPGANAAKIATNYANMFTVKSVQN